MDSNYIELYSADGKEGVDIKGKDVILLDAPEVRLSPDTPLLTEAQDLAGAINELFQLDPGGGDGGGDDIYITAYTDTIITVTVISDRTAETPVITNYPFTFTTKEFKTVTTAKTSKCESTRTWTKNIITSVIDVYGTVFWTLEPNDTGTIAAIYDINGNDILNGTTSGNSVITKTPEGVALGYAIAHNKEQDTIVDTLINAYKSGINDQETVRVDDEETEVIINELKGYGAYYCINRPNNSYVQERIYCEYMQVFFYDENGNAVKGNSDIIASADFRMINIQYYTREDRKGTIHDETEYYYGGTIDHGYIFNSMKQGDMISISGTVYDGDGNVYTGNMIFNF